MNVLYGYLVAFGYLFGLILLLGLLSKKNIIDGELSRKLVHIFIAFTWVIMDIFWGRSYHQIIMCACFTVINLLSYKFKIFPGIERAKRGHAGTVYYALAMLVLSVCAFFYSPIYLPFGCAVFCLSFGDGVAPLAAKFAKRNISIGKKSLVGTLACFVFSFLAVYIFSISYKMSISALQALGIASVCALAELFCGAGLDNFGVTFSVALLCLAAVNPLFTLDFWIAALLCIIVFLPALCVGALTLPAAFAAMIMLLVSAFCGGISATLLYVVPFLIIAVVGVFKHKKKQAEKNAALSCATADKQTEQQSISNTSVASKSKGGRGLVQVLINGAPSAILFIVFAATKHIAFFVGAAGALACGFADSVASDVGFFSKAKPFDFIKRKRVERGISGGITFLGTAASCVGAFAVAACTAICREFSLPVFLLTAASGIFGTFLDSVLGSCLQALYLCPVCGKYTEGTAHCNTTATKVKGFACITNNMVNFISICFSALLVCVIMFLL